MLEKKYNNRLKYLLENIAECCGHECTSLCPACTRRMKKCHNLIKRWHISLIDFVKLIKKIYKSSDKNNFDLEF